MSDGCSSSPDTDFGARVLVRTAIHHMDVFRTIRPVLLAGHASEAIRPLRLRPEALDATLLVVYEEGEAAQAQAWGDGVVAARRRDGGIEIHQIEFPTGAPMYLNYWMHHLRFDRFIKEFGPVRRLTSILPDGRILGEDLASSTLNYETAEPTPIEFRFSRADYDVVAVMSDGVQSFKARSGHNFTPVPMTDVVRSLMAFKGTAGEFVVRRAKAFLRQAEADGWHWDDDVSIAALCLD